MASSARSAITAVTAQNTLGVTAWQAMPADLVTAQIEAVAADFVSDAVKVGMLATAAIVEAVAAAIAELDLPHVVVDPGDGRQGRRSSARRGGHRGDQARAAAAHARPDAECPGGGGSVRACAIASVDDMRAAGQRILASWAARVVLVKGGHLDGPESVDVVCTAHDSFELRRPRVARRARMAPAARCRRRSPPTWRSGSSSDRRSSGLASMLDGAIRHAPGLGRGHGPLGHFWRVY